MDNKPLMCCSVENVFKANNGMSTSFRSVHYNHIRLIYLKYILHFTHETRTGFNIDVIDC